MEIQYGVFINKSDFRKWNISIRRIRRLCTQGKIIGAYKVGAYWLVPADADKPKDERIKSGKYCQK